MGIYSRRKRKQMLEKDTLIPATAKNRDPSQFSPEPHGRPSPLSAFHSILVSRDPGHNYVVMPAAGTAVKQSRALRLKVRGWALPTDTHLLLFMGCTNSYKHTHTYIQSLTSTQTETHCLIWAGKYEAEETMERGHWKDSPDNREQCAMAKEKKWIFKE